MRNSLWGAIILDLGCLVTLLVRTQAAPDAKRTFQPLYGRLDKAYGSKDVNAIFSNYLPDYISIKPTGEQRNIDDVRSGTLKIFAKYKTVHSDSTVQSAKVVKKGATIIVRTITSVARTGDTPGQDLKFGLDEIDRDYWVHLPAGWKLKQERVLSMMRTHGER